MAVANLFFASAHFDSLSCLLKLHKSCASILFFSLKDVYLCTDIYLLVMPTIIYFLLTSWILFHWVFGERLFEGNAS